MYMFNFSRNYQPVFQKAVLKKKMVPVLEKMLVVKAHSQFATLVKTDTTFLKCSLAIHIYIYISRMPQAIISFVPSISTPWNLSEENNQRRIKRLMYRNPKILQLINRISGIH